MNIFDILGPVMVGPSSSHTAGAARIGYITRKLLGSRPKKARIGLSGSFAATGRGHGTDRALVAGLLGMKPDDMRIPESFAVAGQKGLEFEIYNTQIKEAHPNTALLDVEGVDGKTIVVQASSLGGGRIMLNELDGITVDQRLNERTSRQQKKNPPEKQQCDMITFKNPIRKLCKQLNQHQKQPKSRKQYLTPMLSPFCFPDGCQFFFFCYNRRCIFIHLFKHTEFSPGIYEFPACFLTIFCIFLRLFGRTDIFLSSFRKHFHRIHPFSRLFFFKYHSQFPPRKTPSFCCHSLQIFCKCVTFQILKIPKNLFSGFHKIASSQREISSIDTLYFQYIIDTRYCQFLSRTISKIHLQTASVHSHPDCSQFREHPRKLPPFWHLLV